MGDSLWVIMLLALMFPSKNADNNQMNYLNEYKKYGRDE